jgi:transposase
VENFSKLCKMKTKQRRVFSESYKREQVSLIEKGEITVSELARMIGMKNSNPIYMWVKKYGKKPLTERIVIESQSDYMRLKELEKQLKEAEQLIGRQQIRLQFFEGIIDEVEAHYGEDPVKKFLKK